MQFSAHLQILGSSTAWRSEISLSCTLLKLQFDVSQLHFTCFVKHVILSAGNAGLSPEMIVVHSSCSGCVISNGTIVLFYGG